MCQVPFEHFLSQVFRCPLIAQPEHYPDERYDCQQQERAHEISQFTDDFFFFNPIEQVEIDRAKTRIAFHKGVSNESQDKQNNHDKVFDSFNSWVERIPNRQIKVQENQTIACNIQKHGYNRQQFPAFHHVMKYLVKVNEVPVVPKLGKNCNRVFVHMKSTNQVVGVECREIGSIEKHGRRDQRIGVLGKPLVEHQEKSDEHKADS